MNAADAVVSEIGGAVSASIGVGFPGLLQTGATLTGGIEAVAPGLAQTGDVVVTSFETALSDLDLSIEAALGGSFNFGFAA